MCYPDDDGFSWADAAAVVIWAALFAIGCWKLCN